MGDLHHPVSTNNAQAQQFFDQGLRLIYAFNHDEAARSFQRAADLDPKLAMAYWGVAEAVGPNYNDPASDERFAAAHDAIQKAVDLSAGASPAEQAYIKAMALRFPADPKADRRQAAEAYHDAMREVVKKFPDDLDAATLFAESGMNLHPWGLWHQGRNPRSGHRRNRRHAGIGDQAGSQPHGRDPLLHSRGGSLGFSGACAGRRQPTGRHGAGRGTHRPHAGSRLHPHRRYAAAVKTNQAAAAWPIGLTSRPAGRKASIP